MKAGIFIYPGSHGDKELKYILETYFNLSVADVWYRQTEPVESDILFFPSGFPCMNSGAGSGCLKDSPVLKGLASYIDSGKTVVGFGNGFQLLCEAGFLEGRLEQNASGKYICRHLFIKPENNHITFTHELRDDMPYRVPIATYNGRYVAESDTLIRMRLEGRILFRYCDSEGRITEAVNVMGSTDNIAGICNERQNVLGLLPQPERAVMGEQGLADGRLILSSILAMI